jgi:hypothetical protein
MVNEYKDSIKLGKIEVSRKDLRLTEDNTYRFSIGRFKEIEGQIEEGWRFPTEEEFRYIHSVWEDLDVLGLARNSEYWIYGKPKPHPVLHSEPNSSSWELYPSVSLYRYKLEFEESTFMISLRIRLVRDL